MSKVAKTIEFDAEYYLQSNKDLNDTLDLKLHYRNYGWREGRDPSRLFDTTYYLRQNPGFDSVRADPLTHFNEVGRQNGLLARPRNLEFADDFKLIGSIARSAIHCRLTDLSLWPEICDLLEGSKLALPVVLSVDSRADYDAALRYAAGKSVFGIKFICNPVPPGMTDLDALLTATSAHGDGIDRWAHVYTAWELDPHERAYFLSQTIGSRDIIASYVACLSGSKPAGLCFAEPNRVMKQNRLTLVLGSRHADPTVMYPAGSMMWVDQAVLRAVFDGAVPAPKPRELLEKRQAVLVSAILDAAETLGRRPVAFRAAVASPELLLRPAASAKGNHDQQGVRWRAPSPAITQSKPLALSERPCPTNSRLIDLHWVIPDFAEGGGGHMTIFRFVRMLDEAGFRQTLWIQNAHNHRNPAIAFQRIKAWYQPISDQVIVRFLPDDVEAIAGDAVIATDCWTAFPVSRMTRFKERFYFIQDWETEFHPAGDLRMAAGATHHFGFTALTAGKWLEQKSREAGMDVVSWNLGADRIHYRSKAADQISRTVFSPSGDDSRFDRYRAVKIESNGSADSLKAPKFRYWKNGSPFQLAKEAPSIAQIALYSRGFTPRRAVDLAMAGLRTLAERGWLFHVHLYGEERDYGELPFLYTPHGITDPAMLGRIYEVCDLGIAFSATNYSLVPLEMMVSDLPVLEIDTESTRAAYPADAVVRAEPTAHAVADELESLLTSPDQRIALIEAGRKFMAENSWEASGKIVEDAIRSRVTAKASVDVYQTLEAVKARSQQPILPAPGLIERPAISIFIPTFNAGADFDVVLQAIAEQRIDAPFELVVIDSGSTDETLDRLAAWSDRIRTTTITIDNSEFGHGRTRNRGIDASQGEYVAILTQDACPASPTWLQKLVEGFGAGDRVAGVFGRHIAYPAHALFEGPGMDEFFEKFRLLGPLYSTDCTFPSYVHRGSPDWQSALQFYSDNNSCMRKSVWAELPYDDVPWGEDQVWAWNALRLGFQKAYAHEAAVYHSHDYRSKKLLQVGREEGRMFFEHFGMYIGLDGDTRDSDQQILSMIRASVSSDEKKLAELGIESDSLLLRRALQYLALFKGRSDGLTESKRRFRK